jgi:hypothetical protein
MQELFPSQGWNGDWQVDGSHGSLAAAYEAFPTNGAGKALRKSFIS